MQYLIQSVLTIPTSTDHGRVAQLVEQRIEAPCVASSTLALTIGLVVNLKTTWWIGFPIIEPKG